jgi:DNA-binding transcriptional LysR family regulator
MWSELQMKLDPLSLKLFVTVIEEGTIAAAAEREHIVASAVSKRLSELEVVLDTQLLQRSNKGIQPTEAGVALLSLARGVLHDLDDVYLQMREYSSGTRGFVRVFANISTITQFLPTELNRFLGKYPLVEVHLEERISTVITKSVAESVADIGIFTLGTHAQNVEIFPYGSDQLVLITPKDHPLAKRKSVSFSETLDYNYVGLHAGGSMNLQLVNVASHFGKSLKLRMQVTSFDALCLMVEAGLGIGILPRDSAKVFLKSLNINVIALDEPWAKRELAICVRSYDSLSVAAKSLVDHLRKPSSS